MEIQGNQITGSNLVGEVKSEVQPNKALVEEIEILMNKYSVDYMWFGWSKYGAVLENNYVPRDEHERLVRVARGAGEADGYAKALDEIEEDKG